MFISFFHNYFPRAKLMPEMFWKLEEDRLFALFSGAISCLYHILQGVQRYVSLSFSVLFLSAISGGVYDLQLSLSFPLAQFTLLNTLHSVLTLYGVIAFLPLRKVIDRGYTQSDIKKLDDREAAAVLMLDDRILTDVEFQKEAKDYLLKRVCLEKSFPVGELERDENSLYALFFLAHECVKRYIPKRDKESMLDRADKGQVDLQEELYGKKSKKH